MMEEFLARHGGKGAVSKAEREAEQKVSVTHPVTERLKSEKRYTVTREVKRYSVTRRITARALSSSSASMFSRLSPIFRPLSVVASETF